MLYTMLKTLETRGIDAATTTLSRDAAIIIVNLPNYSAIDGG